MRTCRCASRAERRDGGARWTARTYAIDSDWQFGGIRASGTCNGRPFTAQVERARPVAAASTHNGRRIEALVMSARAAELLR